MNYEISDIKRMRRQLGITQTELANRARVSQSLVAKIESGIIDPGYSKINALFRALESMKVKNELRAVDVMTKKVIHTTSKTSIKTAAHLMRTSEISQLPVIDDGRVVGLVTDKAMLESISSGKKYVEDVMEDSPPTVSENTSITVLINILKSYPIIPVTVKGKIGGVITKSDVLNSIY
jgi:predicted transcriptional regulator